MNEQHHASHEDLYEFEIQRFQDLLKQDRDYAFKRYGMTLFYSLPPEETYTLLNELGWKGQEGLDLYNHGAMACQQGNLKEAMKLFEKAEAQGCEQPELFFNIAAIHEENNNHEQAKVYYQKYIDAVEKYEYIPQDTEIELDELREHLKNL